MAGCDDYYKSTIPRHSLLYFEIFILLEVIVSWHFLSNCFLKLIKIVFRLLRLAMSTVNFGKALLSI
jgi:hypothetical protein